MVSYLSFVVGLWVSHRSEVLDNAIALAKLDEFGARELTFVISDEHLQEIESVNNELLDEVYYLGFGDLSERFSFYPFNEVVDGHK